MSEYEWTERKCDKLFNVVYFFIAVFNFLLPVKAAFHYGGLYIIYDSYYLKYGIITGSLPADYSCARYSGGPGSKLQIQHLLIIAEN